MHYFTHTITRSEVPCAHDPACRAMHMVSVQKELQYLPVVFQADPFDSST